MMIVIPVYDTLENNRTQYTELALDSIVSTVDFSNGHRLIVVDNGSCNSTVKLYENYRGIIEKVIYLPKNIGIARATNKAWMERKPYEHALRMDNDIVIHAEGWVDQMEDVFKREPKIGVVGLKRKDNWQHPDNPNDWFKSKLFMLHQPYKNVWTRDPSEGPAPWLVVEETDHIMGTCAAYRSNLLDNMGYLYEFGALYGFEDALACVRAHVLGFRTVYLPGIEIDHLEFLDSIGNLTYEKWKREQASPNLEKFALLKADLLAGKRSPYYGPED